MNCIKNITIEKMFLIISIVFGLLLVFIVPPFQSPDEDTHFLKSYLISKGDFYLKQNGKKVGFNISINLNDYIADKKNMMSDLSKKYTYSDQYYDQLLSFDYNEEIFKNITTGQTTIIAHIIPAIGIKIASLIPSFNDGGNVGPAVLLQYARIVCLIVYTLIGYFAIKITPKFKKTFFTILLLPSSLFLRSMVSYDSLILVITALSLAKMLQIYCDEKYHFQKKDMVLFIVCGYILLNVKTIYAYIFLLMFAIPNEKFGGRKNKIKYFVIMILSAVGLTILLNIPNYLLNIPSNELISKQIKFIINNPFKYIKILLNNMFSQIGMEIYWMVGTYGLLDTYIPVLLLNIIYINLVVVIIYEVVIERFDLPILVCVSYIIFAFLSICAIYSAMYINWVPVILNEAGGNIITGVQGRYFLPYLFTIPLMFSNKLFHRVSKVFYNFFKKCQLNMANIHYLVSITCLLISIIIIFERYWI